MIEGLKRHTTTIVVAMVTAALTAATPAIAATVVDYARNAGAVDGKSAVGASATAKQRAGKLVATNKSGYLPGSIIKTLDWTQLGNVPAGFADGTDDVGAAADWNTLPNIPSGFADGTDDVGYYKGTQVSGNVGVGSNQYWFTFGYNAGQLVVWRALPTTTGGKVKLDVETEAAGDGTVTYWLRVTNVGSVASDYQLIRYTFTN
jgi:hypothetical protein